MHKQYHLSGPKAETDKMRKTLIAGNWKMYLNTNQASLLLHRLDQKVDVAHRDIEVVLCPNNLVLQSLSLQVDHRKFKLGAQNCYYRDEGPYTGEVSATMLRGLVDYVIVGHSERRYIFGERDNEIKQKVQAIIRNGMRPILCIGETAGERVAHETSDVIHHQLAAGLANITSNEIEEVVIAYEPIWAIGTGENADPNEVKTVVNLIRQQIAALYGKKAAENIRILYGGSVNSQNATDYVRIEGVDGLLVGGDSIKASAFSHILDVVYDVMKEKENKLEQTR